MIAFQANQNCEPLQSIIAIFGRDKLQSDDVSGLIVLVRTVGLLGLLPR